ncbi:L-cystine transporter [Frischella perrara]|uniref:L-cystine transporter n=1 Tax=Frischella perrara TaxID=1267021 RepID=UPI0023F40273|nr:cation:dicarboxylase symporter family transporter [Frischella perrara]MCT6874820.1 cation:dicarboxylase symporter family transporter [Frischella perrara]
MLLFLNVGIFSILLLGLIYIHFHYKTWTLSRKVFIALVAGLLFGIILQIIYSANNPAIISQSVEWFNIVGNGYVKLLQMIVMPLIFVSILSAVAKLHDAASLGKISSFVISMLLLTTLIAAIVAIIVSLSFNLTANELTSGIQEQARAIKLQEIKSNTLDNLSVPAMLLSFLPSNPFQDLAGLRSTSIMGVVIFAIFLGIAALKLLKDNQEQGATLLSGIIILQQWIMKLVRMVIQLTPYGVFALMVKMSATSDAKSMLSLGLFIIASYIAILIMFIIHGVLVMLVGESFIGYFKKITTIMAFAFTSRSSAAAIPLNIQTQETRFGVPNSIASFSASFGAIIGQNGCAGIYPAMLAMMIAPTIGIDLNLQFLITLVFVVTISSIGVAGVGGGATYAALIVLPIMGLPIELVALLISIEPIIDMGRTALNVSGTMTSGIVTAHLLKQINKNQIEQN